ncbi:MAG TPA: metallophosphoesterase [Vicinamibacterales bacterium]|nr:metallophosphoesterase [Vicinamibacterales bacterium]
MRTTFALLLIAGLMPPPLTAQAPRIVAVGDIHGSFDGITAILKRAGLIDEALKWSGGRATLVQTGDYTDRGTDVRKVLDLLMRLEREAKAAGGQALILLGNHEVMNLIGDWRDVTPAICASFVTAISDVRREDAWKQYQRLGQRRPATAAPVAAYQQTRETWMAAHPPGCLEYREAMSPSGVYGKWLREKSIAAQVGDSLFMHAGLNPLRPAPKSLAEVNDRARAEIRRLDAHRQRLVAKKLALPSFSLQQLLEVNVAELQTATNSIAAAQALGREAPALDLPLLREAQELLNIGTWSLVDPEGPLWFRGYAQWDEATTLAQVEAFLTQMKLARVVVGHSPTRDRRITPRFRGRAVIIDTGMLAPVYQGNPSALEITGDKLKAIYVDGEVDLTATPAKAVASGVAAGTPLRTRAKRPDALATAKLKPLRLRSGGTPGIGRG